MGYGFSGRIQALFVQMAGGVIGTGLASVATAATPRYGPPIVTLWGIDIPIFSALFGVIGLVLARQVAPASAAGARLGRTGNVALTALLGMGVLALVLTGEKRPIVALAWAVGLGYSGLGIVELVARGVVTAARVAIDAFTAAWSQGKGGSNV